MLVQPEMSIPEHPQECCRVLGVLSILLCCWAHFQCLLLLEQVGNALLALPVLLQGGPEHPLGFVTPHLLSLMRSGTRGMSWNGALS